METLITERHDQVLMVRLNRPRRRNAINIDMLDDLDHLLDEVENAEDVRAIVLTGDERAFCAGQDLKEPEPANFVDRINAVFNRLEQLPKPTVAAIDGWCMAGGLELALTCDLRIASEDAQIGDWHAHINSIGGAGATVRLVRLIGLPKAKELVFSGKLLEAQAAREAGLVSHVYPRGELQSRAIEHAASLCVADPVTIRYAKQSLHAAADLALNEAMSHSLLCQHAVRAALHPDYAERFVRRREDDSGGGA